jgi:hypothetical protein
MVSSNFFEVIYECCKNVMPTDFNLDYSKVFSYNRHLADQGGKCGFIMKWNSIVNS